MNKEIAHAQAVSKSSWNLIRYLMDHDDYPPPLNSPVADEPIIFDFSNHKEKKTLTCEWCGAKNALRALECKKCGSPIIDEK